METKFPDVVYLCPKCLIGQEAEGLCPYDGTELIECHPGSREDPQRRPIMDGAGHVVTRAPKWWLRFSVKDLLGFLDSKTGR